MTGDGADGGLERAEALAERDLLVIGERLPPEEQHRVIVERARDLAKHGLVDPSNVDADDLHAERRVQRSHVERHGRLPDECCLAVTSMIGERHIARKYAMVAGVALTLGSGRDRVGPAVGSKHP